MYSSRSTHPYHFQTDLIWCDGTFKRLGSKEFLYFKKINREKLIYFNTANIVQARACPLQPNGKSHHELRFYFSVQSYTVYYKPCFLESHNKLLLQMYFSDTACFEPDKISVHTRQSYIEIRLQMSGLFRCWWLFYPFYGYTDKKENKIFLIYKEIQKGSVAKSSRPPHIWLNICVVRHILGSLPQFWLCNRSHLNFLICEENFVFFFISVKI